MNYAWLDFETTGLNHETCEIALAGCIVTTPQLELIDADAFGIALDDQQLEKTIPQVLSSYLECDDFVDDAKQADLRLSKFLDSCGGYKPMWCGSGIQFDRPFVQEYLPKSFDRLNFTCFDLRGLAQFVGDRYGVHKRLDILCDPAADLADMISTMQTYQTRHFTPYNKAKKKR